MIKAHNIKNNKAHFTIVLTVVFYLLVGLNECANKLNVLIEKG